MNAMKSILTLGIAALLVPPAVSQETKETRIGNLTFESGYPSKESVQKLYDEMDFQRRLPGLHLGNFRGRAARMAKGPFRCLWGKDGEMLSYLDFAGKLGILTPNYTTPYIATFVDLEKSGPFVIEVPPGLMAGMILDNWQRVLADLGVVGPDKGKGGKYLILPPGYEKVEPAGYFVTQSPSRFVLGGVRLLGDDKEKAIRDLIPGMKTYTGPRTARASRCRSAVPVIRSGVRCRHGVWPIGKASTNAYRTNRSWTAIGSSSHSSASWESRRAKSSSPTLAKRRFLKMRSSSAKRWPRPTLQTSALNRHSGRHQLEARAGRLRGPTHARL